AALRSLSDAIDSYRHAGSRLLVARMLLARGRIHERLGKEEQAQADFELGIDMFEQARESLAGSAQRVDYFEEAWGLFDSLVSLHVRHGRFEAAFAAAERGRAHEMRVGLRRDLADLRLFTNNLSPHTTVLYYVVLPDALVTWALRRGTWSCER